MGTAKSIYGLGGAEVPCVPADLCEWDQILQAAPLSLPWHCSWRFTQSKESENAHVPTAQWIKTWKRLEKGNFQAGFKFEPWE